MEIPRTVTNIGDCFFIDSFELTSLTCHATTPPVFSSEEQFDADTYGVATLYVPASAVDAYKTANVWKKFVNVVGIEESFLPGDVDGDGRITISDVTELIDLLLTGTMAGNPAADVDGDGRVSISDVTELIDYLLLH